MLPKKKDDIIKIIKARKTSFDAAKLRRGDSAPPQLTSLQEASLRMTYTYYRIDVIGEVYDTKNKVWVRRTDKSSNDSGRIYTTRHKRRYEFYRKHVLKEVYDSSNNTWLSTDNTIKHPHRV